MTPAGRGRHRAVWQARWVMRWNVWASPSRRSLVWTSTGASHPAEHDDVAADGHEGEAHVEVVAGVGFETRESPLARRPPGRPRPLTGNWQPAADLQRVQRPVPGTAPRLPAGRTCRRYTLTPSRAPPIRRPRSPPAFPAAVRRPLQPLEWAVAELSAGLWDWPVPR
jgi:hypothetical protein